MVQGIFSGIIWTASTIYSDSDEQPKPPESFHTECSNMSFDNEHSPNKQFVQKNLGTEEYSWESDRYSAVCEKDKECLETVSITIAIHAEIVPYTFHNLLYNEDNLP